VPEEGLPLLFDFNNTTVDVTDKTIIRATPNNVLVFEGTELTYKQLKYM
jgi:hypothetical protein